MDQLKASMHSIRTISDYFWYPLFVISIIAIFLVAPASLQAQNGGFAGSFSRMGFGPRGMAMGNALTAVTSEGIYAHYNPALAADISEGVQLDLSSALMNFDRTLHNLTGSFPLPPSAGLSISLINANVSDIDGRTQSGYHTGYLSTSEYQLQTAFGLRAGKNVYLGTAVKYNMADYHDQVPRASGIGLDLGALIKPLPSLNIGLAIKDLFASYSWDTSNLYNLDGSRDVVDQFPTRFLIGASYSINADWVAAVNYEIRYQSSDVTRSDMVVESGQPQLVTRRNTINTNSQQLRFGSSYQLHERFTLRGGWQIQEMDRPADSGQLSAGFSIHLPFDKFKPSVDYAFVQEPSGFSNFHVFSLRFHL